MEIREITKKLEQVFSASVVSDATEGALPSIEVKVDSLKSVLSFCQHEAALRFDFLEFISALDTGQDFIVMYHLFSTGFGHRLHIKVAIERHAAKVPSASGFWGAAYAYELEAAEMFGLTFEGHPDPKHLLLPEDWQGYPLRKDYMFPEEYQGVEHRRAPLRREHARP